MARTVRTPAWDDLRLIDAIARARTLPEAATRLGLDHSTVFRRLRQIEAGLGTPLFERHRDGYVPTAAGEEVAALAARMDEDVTAVMRRVAGLSPSPAGEIRLATSDTLLFDLLMPLLAEFRAACPDVRLDVVTGNNVVNLSRRDADVAVRATRHPPDTLVGRKAGRIGWAAYGPAGAWGPDAAWDDDVPWVGFGDALAGLGAPGGTYARVPAGRIVCRFDTVAALVAGVAAGLGRGVLPCFAGDRHPALVRLLPPVAEASSDLWLLTHPDLRRVPRVRALLDFLGERLAALRPMLEGTVG